MTKSCIDFFFVLSEIGLTEKDAMNKHMISHVESVLKEDNDAKATVNEGIEKLSTITES